MSKAPPIPPEQQSFGEKQVDVSGEDQDRRDLKINAQSGQPGDADVNKDQQGRFGNISQNLTPQRRTQDR
ncbi:hypothetical protein Q0812_02420 [Brevundimonas sp. 2R-24]|uniref:Uncharacterized protein n=1 Tax=Peiella sedimenti TaxID=3061083 RepID=A0ABT8SIS9_9CAUL|nr:hypothetical protein [Caulobacteraceae bacterium XZ-24]